MTRPMRRIGALLVLAALLVTAGPAGAERARPAQEEAEESASAATIALAARSPWIGEDRPLTLDVVVDGDAAGTTMRVRIHPPIDSAEDLATSLDDDVGGITRAIDLGPTDEIPVAADGTRRIEVTSDDIRLPGVHPVVVELRSDDGGILGVVRTPVVRLGTDDDPLPAPTLSVVVDVAVPPTLDADGRRDLATAELDRMERLAGFLDGLRTLDDPPPVTVVAVPDTIEALAATSDPIAADVLEAVRSVVAMDTTTVVAHPYAPVSAGALVAAGLGDVVETTTAAGSQVLVDRLGADPSTALWPDGDVTPDAAAILAVGGVRTVLTGSRTAASVGDDAEPAPSEPTTGPDAAPGALTPAGPRPVAALAESGLDALVVDDDLSTALTAPVGDRVDAAEIAVADLLVRDDARGSAVVVRLDDAPEGSLLEALAPRLTQAGSPVAFGALPTGEPEADLEGAQPEPVTLPVGSADDLTPIADRYRSVDEDLATFEAFAAPTSSQASGLRAQLLTSIADELTDERRSGLLDAVEGVMASRFGAVTLTGQTDLNLTSRTGSLPIAVRNDGNEAVRVMVRIRSDRLRFPDGEEFTLVAGPDVTRFDIPVEALATGSVPTFVEIRTPDGVVLLDERQLNVRSTAVSGVGLALSLGALAVLAVWWVRTWRRNRHSGDSDHFGDSMPNDDPSADIPERG